MGPTAVYGRPTSVFVYGESRELVDWLVYGLAVAADPGFIWTDVRSAGETLPPTHPLALGLVPPDRLNVLAPTEISAIRNGSPPAGREEPSAAGTLHHIADFLRMPLLTQRLVTGAPNPGRPIVLVLSNAQRLDREFPEAEAAPRVNALVEAGTILIVGYHGGASRSREIFSTVLRIEGSQGPSWAESVVHVERSGDDDPLPSPGTHRLGDLEPVATVLAAARR